MVLKLVVHGKAVLAGSGAVRKVRFWQGGQGGVGSGPLGKD